MKEKLTMKEFKNEYYRTNKWMLKRKLK